MIPATSLPPGPRRLWRRGGFVAFEELVSERVVQTDQFDVGTIFR